MNSRNNRTVSPKSSLQDRDAVLRLMARYANLSSRLPPGLSTENIAATSVILDEMTATKNEIDNIIARQPVQR